MQYNKVLVLVMFIFELGSVCLIAQETISVTGSNATGDGGSVSYTIGQVFYTSVKGTTGTSLQGVQQPFEISVVSGIEEKLGISLALSVYPNPANDYLTMKIENFGKENLSYKLFDINGKLLINRKIEGSETNIDMSQFVVSTYFLNVIQDNRDVKTFKIIKIK